MTRYQNMFQSEEKERVERALKRYNTDKEILDADSVNFQSIDNMDIGERYVVSYYMPVIVPISEILWIKFTEFFGRTHMWMLVSDGYLQFLLVEDDNNIDTIVKMLRDRNKNLIYGDNKDLYTLYDSDFEEFRKLIALHPNEDAADIKVDPALLPAPEEEVTETPEENSEEPKTPYIPPKEQDLDSVTVPEDLPFAEEMNLFLHLAKTYPDDVYMTLYEPVSALTIEEFEARNNIKLTDELKSFFMFTNGFDISAGNIDINSLDIIERYLSAEWEWGDEKNYVYIGDRIGDGEIILLDLDSGNIITNDHGEEIDYGDLTTLLSDAIYTFLDGEVDDEKLDEYIAEIEAMNE